MRRRRARPEVARLRAGMRGAVRRLLIGYFTPLSGKLYCRRGPEEIQGRADYLPAYPDTSNIAAILSHSPAICRRVNSFSLFSLFWDDKLPVSPPPLPESPAFYRRPFPEGQNAVADKRER